MYEEMKKKRPIKSISQSEISPSEKYDQSSWDDKLNFVFIAKVVFISKFTNNVW